LLTLTFPYNGTGSDVCATSCQGRYQRYAMNSVQVTASVANYSVYGSYTQHDVEQYARLHSILHASEDVTSNTGSLSRLPNMAFVYIEV
jgi:hypothetical protein